MTEPLARAEPDWLASRVAADTAARVVTETTLLPRLLSQVGPKVSLHVIDVGAGTGANQRWLRPRLDLPQRWTHLDHDELIIDHARLPGTAYVVGPISDLEKLIIDEPTLITCSALLDVLDASALDSLIDIVIKAAAPALFSLTVTGAVTLSPADPLDELITTSFNDHQRRGGRPGPQAAARAVGRFDLAGYSVTEVSTPWVLGPDADQEFVDRYLTERLAVAAQVEPAVSEARAEWLARRRTELAAGRLAVRVDHVDLLALPGHRSARPAAGLEYSAP